MISSIILEPVKSLSIFFLVKTVEINKLLNKLCHFKSRGFWGVCGTMGSYFPMQQGNVGK